MKTTLALLVIVAAASITLSLTSCAHREISVEESAMSLYQEFFNTAAAHGVYLEQATDVVIAPLPPTVVGLCSSDEDGWPVVTISPEVWSGSSDWERRYVMFHELAHCEMMREHDDHYSRVYVNIGKSSLSFNLPATVMNSRHSTSDVLLISNFWDKYMANLFWGEKVQIPPIEFSGEGEVRLTEEQDIALVSWRSTLVFEKYKIFRNDQLIATVDGHSAMANIRDPGASEHDVYTIVPEIGPRLSFWFAFEVAQARN